MSNSKVVWLQAVMLVGYGGKLPEGDREKLLECVMSEGVSGNLPESVGGTDLYSLTLAGTNSLMKRNTAVSRCEEGYLKQNEISIGSLMQLTKINIQKDLKLSKSIFEENIFLIEKDFRKTLQLTPKSSLSQRKDIPNDPELQLIERIVQNDSFLKNLISLVEKEEDIPVIPQSQLIERGISENLLLSPPLNVLSQLTKNIVQNNFSWKLFLPLIERKLLKREKIHRTISKKPNKNTKMRLNVRLIRIRDKLVLCLSALAIVFTLLLVMDLQMDLGYSGHHLNPSHARVRIGDSPETDTVYNNFRRKFLQRGNGSREQANNDVTPIIEKSKKSGVMSLSSIKKHDDFSDLMDLVVNGYAVNVDEGVAIISRENREYNPTIGELRKMTLNGLQVLIDYFKQKLKVSKFTLQECYNLSCKLSNQSDHFLFLEHYRNTFLELKL
ncbi:hypothetical protein ALC57_11044 [Trachymyrmex cornetzi]|uniref:Uncharacterized protein n=1 Tax=Trachymyrmex cornetzi TaxID=471704 RepID=A0A151J330_9HYME|nr:hypothetical protein ALC57_11044 [Trachymyrmex cornetzi]